MIEPIVRRTERFVTVEELNSAELARLLARAKRLINPVTDVSAYIA